MKKEKNNMYLIVAIISTIGALILLLLLFAFNAEAGRVKHKTKIRYKCFSEGVRVPCPEGHKQSPEFKQYLRQKKARLHDTRRYYYKDKTRPRPSNERTYMKSYPRDYYDETIREEVE
jgi:hypothetical protein